MESDERRRVHSSGGEGNGGVHVCHACGWAYSNAHPSAKQRRAHRKNCGKLAVASGSGRKGPDEEVSDEEKSKMKGGDGLMVGGGDGKEIKQNGGNVVLDFAGSGGDGGILEKGENLASNSTDATFLVLARTEESDYMKLQSPSGDSTVVDLRNSATYAENAHDICLPEVPFESGGHVSASSSEDSLLEKFAKHPEVSIPINHANHTQTQMKDFPAEITANSKDLDLSVSCMEDEKMDEAGHLSQNLASCKAVDSCQSNASEHPDASVYSLQPETENGIPDNFHVDGESKSLNSLPMEASALLGKTTMQMLGSWQDYCAMEPNLTVISLGGKAENEPEYNLAGEVSEMALSESVVINSDASVLNNSLNQYLHETNPFLEKSVNASMINESNDDPNSLNGHFNGERSPSADFEYESAVSAETFGGSKGLGMESNLENSHTMAAELSRSQAIAQDKQVSGSHETCVTRNHLEAVETEHPSDSEDNYTNNTHEFISESDTIASNVDCVSQCGVSHANEAVKAENEKYSYIQEGTGHNLYEMVRELKTCKESPQSDTSSECSEISFRDSHMFECQSDRFNHDKTFDKQFEEPADKYERNDLTMQEEIEVKHKHTETSLSKEALGTYESQNSCAENVSGTHLSVRNHHQDSSIESVVGTGLVSEINVIVGITSEEKESNDDALGLCHKKAQAFPVEGHLTSLMDTESCIMKSVASDDAKTDVKFDVIPSDGCQQNLLGGQSHVVSNQQPCLIDSSIYPNSHTSNVEGKQDSVPDENAPAVRHTANGQLSHETQTPAPGSMHTIKDLCISDTAEEDRLLETSADRNDVEASPSHVTPANPGRTSISHEIHAEQNAQDESKGKSKEDINVKVARRNSGKAAVPLKALLAEASLEANLETEKAEEQTMPSKKRKPKKDATSAKSSASSRNASDHQEWDSPARLPMSRNTKRKSRGKQPWLPFMCCSSVD